MHFSSKIALVGAFALLAAACSPTFTATGPTFPSRGEECDFQILTATPTSGFQEIGVIDLRYASANLARLKRAIEPHVCQAGGDAALVFINGAGVYVKATVIKLLPPGTMPMMAPATTTTPAATAIPTANGVGCKNDMQCKGDRVCVKNECVAPAGGK